MNMQQINNLPVNIMAKSVFDVICHDKYGREKWRTPALNRVVNAGLTDLIDKTFKAAAYTAAWFIGMTTALPTHAISGATQANPCVITATAHGRSTGDRIVIAGVAGMTQLNNAQYTITVINANSYSLNGINSSGYGAYTSGGTAYVDPSAAADTMASHAGWTEFTAYGEATRGTLTLGTVSNGVADNTAARPTLTCNANGSSVGALFLATNSTKGGTTGTLFCLAPFLQGNKSLDSGDTITLGTTITATGA